MNPNTIPWLHYQDIQVSDVAIRSQFDNAMRNGDYVDAIKLLANNKAQLDGKAFISDTITHIITGILTLENKFTNGVNLFLSNLASQYDLMINSFKNMKEWNSVFEYIPYNFVSYQAETYMAIDNVPVNTLPTDETYWLKLGLTGESGVPGVDVTMRYNWDSSKTYNLNDLVVYDNNIYVALKTNTGVVPGTDEATWLTFILTSMGKITVSNVAPEYPVNNEVWFKTDVDPLSSTSNLQGTFNRCNKQQDWEPMYPETIFTWVEGRENYAPIAVHYEVDIQVADWTFANEVYIYTYANNKIKDSSLVEVAPNNFVDKAQTELYNSLSIEVGLCDIKLTTDKEPTVVLPINIKIQ